MQLHNSPFTPHICKLANWSNACEKLQTIQTLQRMNAYRHSHTQIKNAICFDLKGSIQYETNNNTHSYEIRNYICNRMCTTASEPCKLYGWRKKWYKGNGAIKFSQTTTIDEAFGRSSFYYFVFTHSLSLHGTHSILYAAHNQRSYINITYSEIKEKRSNKRKKIQQQQLTAVDQNLCILRSLHPVPISIYTSLSRFLVYE